MSIIICENTSELVNNSLCSCFGVDGTSHPVAKVTHLREGKLLY